MSEGNGMASLHWEPVINENRSGYTERAKVPGGWVLRLTEDVPSDMTDVGRGRFEVGYEWRSSICFIPDPSHEWGKEASNG